MSINVVQRYDREMRTPGVDEYYVNSDFYNFGYWTAGVRTARDACENLVEKLLSFLPQRAGTILDVACGLGATTRHLLSYYDPANVVGINISERQLERCRLNAPGCTFLLMDAAHLSFADNSFDNVICVEAAFHFDTREQFLREAYRVLKPGGRLVLSDVLMTRLATRLNRQMPTKNYVRDLEEYRAVYRRAGFDEVDVVDATKECWTAFYYHCLRWAFKKLVAREISPLAAARGLFKPFIGNFVITHYLLVCAKKA